MSNLIVLTYESAEKGHLALDELASLQKQHLIEVEDAALAVKTEKGKVKVTQTLEKMTTGASVAWGGFWGLLIGLIFGGPIFWALFTGLLGFIFGKTADLGIDNNFIKEVGDSLETNNSALFVLIYSATYDKVVEEMSKLGGTVYQTSFSKEDEEKFKDALNHENVAEAVKEVADF